MGSLLYTSSVLFGGLLLFFDQNIAFYQLKKKKNDIQNAYSASFAFIFISMTTCEFHIIVEHVWFHSVSKFVTPLLFDGSGAVECYDFCF